MRIHPSHPRKSVFYARLHRLDVLRLRLGPRWAHPRADLRGQICYAVVGGMALFRHGLRRFTEDVDLLVTSR
jgi:hypothetical protein